MLNNLKNTAKHSVIYSIGNLSTKLIGFVLLPLYTTHLTLGDYGILGLIETTATILMAVLSFRIPVAMQRWCAQHEEANDRKRIVFMSFSMLLLIVLALNGFAQPFTTKLSAWILGDPQYGELITIMLCSVSFEILNMVPLELLRFQEKSIRYITIISLKLLVILGLNIYFIVHLGMGIKGVLLSQMIGSASLLLLTSIYLLRNFRFGFDADITKQMLKYGAPLVFTTISTMVLTLSDRYILNYYWGHEDLGLYTLGYKIGSVINIFVLQSFAMGYLPIAYKLYGEPTFPRFHSKTLTYLVFVLGFCIIGLSAYSQEVIKYLSENPAYWSAYNIVPIVALVFLFKGIQYVFTLTFHFVKKTQLNIKVVLVGVVVNLILNFLLIPSFNFYGAMVATLAALITMCFHVYFVSQKEFKVQFELKKVTQIIMVTVLLLGVVYWLNTMPLLIRLPTKILVPLTLPVVLYAFGFFEAKELSAIIGFVKKWRSPGQLFNNIKGL